MYAKNFNINIILSHLFILGYYNYSTFIHFRV